jgi:hypothetical protein
MRSVRRPDEYHDLLERAAADRVKRALTGNSELADRNDVLLPDRQSAELGAAARRDNSGHIPAFSIGRPVPGPRLRPSSGRAGRHQCGCGNEGGCSQADDHSGQHGSSAEPPLYWKMGRASQMSTGRDACFIVRDANYVYFEGEPGHPAGRAAAKLLTRTWHLPMQRRAEDCVTVQSIGSIFLSELQESTDVAREASFDEAKAQHQCSTGVERRRIVIVASKRSVCRNRQACSGCADAENRNESRNHTV